MNKTRSYIPILLIFNSKHGVTKFYIVSTFEVNRTKKKTKWPPCDIKLRYPQSEKNDTQTHRHTDRHRSNPRKVGPLSETRKLGPQTHSHSPYWYLLTDYFNTLKLHCKRLTYFGLTCLAIGPEQCQFAKNGALKVGPYVWKTPEK